MKVFMLGWEFPPYISGGLGTACYGLTKALNKLGLDITFVLPKGIGHDSTEHVKMLSPASLAGTRISETFQDELKHVRFLAVDSPLHPYDSPDIYQKRIDVKR